MASLLCLLHVHRSDDATALVGGQLENIQTVHAMTIHKSQGSEFDNVVVLLPDASSRLLTRELLYTAISRARTDLAVVGTEEAIRKAIRRQEERASGLQELLWDAPPGEGVNSRGT